MSPAVLVTGGAGYIGSHTCRHLLDAGHRLVVLDNFYSGHRWAVPPDAVLVEGDAGDRGLVAEVLQAHRIEAVIHFAGHIVVPESVAEPLKYYRNNTVASCRLLEACTQAGVKHFIYSSTAAVYGIPERLPVNEDAPLAPINPYGRSKLMTEEILRDLAQSMGGADNARFRYVILRYFNVAGARLDGTLGQATPQTTHLIKVACEAACGVRDVVTIYGADYPTPDGTCIRDYIHVDDLARAHVAALAYLQAGGRSQVLNCGYGTGYSVRQVLDTMRAVSQVDFAVEIGERRLGDAPGVVADATRIHAVLDWQPQHQDLRVICRSAFEWQVKYLRMQAHD